MFNLILGQGFVTLLIFLDFSCIYKNDHLHMWVSLYIELVWGDLTKNCLSLRRQEHFCLNSVWHDLQFIFYQNLTWCDLQFSHKTITYLHPRVFVWCSKISAAVVFPIFLDTPLRHHFVCFVWYSSIWTTIDLSFILKNGLPISLSFNINFTRPIKEAILGNLKVSTHPPCRFLKIFWNPKVKCYIPLPIVPFNFALFSFPSSSRNSL